MATAVRRGRGLKDRNIGESAGIRPYKLDPVYATVSAFLTAKSALGENSSSAEAGDWFYNSTVGDLWFYDGNIWQGASKNAAVYESFSEGAAKGLAILQSDGTAYDSTALSLNIMHLPSGNKIAATALVAETLPPAMIAGGLDIAGDQTANDGFELTSGILGTSGRPFIVGTDPAFYFKATFQLGDIDGTDDFQMGFRRLETVNAAFDDYTDAATLGCNTAADPMAIKIATIQAAAATVETDTTDTLAQDTSVTFQVNVSATGVVTYLIDGVAPTATAAYTFTDGAPVVPFFRFLQDTALVDDFTLEHWEVGFQ